MGRKGAALAGLLALAGVPALAGAAAVANAQAPRAGLVIHMPDGTVHEACVSLPEERVTGLDLLALAGFDVTAEVNALGSTVCAIDGGGCGYPAEPCWCQCRNLGAECTYWAYHTSDGGAWRYSTLGAQARVVRDGDVDGWAWGQGQEGSGAAPPHRAFEEVCRGPAADTPTESPREEDPDPTPEPEAGETAAGAEGDAVPGGAAGDATQDAADRASVAAAGGPPSAATVEALATGLALAVRQRGAGLPGGRLDGGRTSPGAGRATAQAGAVPRIALAEGSATPGPIAADSTDGRSGTDGGPVPGDDASSTGSTAVAGEGIAGYAVAGGLLLALAVVSWVVRRGRG